MLPVETLASITGAAGGDVGVKEETRKVEQLPQHFADRFGWENMVATVAGVHRGLPPEERSESCILTGNYGEAGAIDFFGPRYDLPKAIRGHNNYYIWGPGECSGEVVISVGVPRDTLEAVFEDVTQADTVQCEYCMRTKITFPCTSAGVLRRPSERYGRNSSISTEPGSMMRVVNTRETAGRLKVLTLLASHLEVLLDAPEA